MCVCVGVWQMAGDRRREAVRAMGCRSLADKIGCLQLLTYLPSILSLSSTTSTQTYNYIAHTESSAMVEHRAPSRSNSSGANTMVDDEEKASPAASTVGYQDQAGTSKLPESCSKAGRQHSHSTSTVNTRESSQGRAAGSEKPDARAEKGADLEAGSPQWTIVDWDGPADPANPQNWSIRKKWSATTIVSLFTFMVSNNPLAYFLLRRGFSC